MNLFFRPLLGIMIVGALALGQPSVALANGGHIHLYGDVGIPYVVVWLGGGLMVMLFLFFFIGWTYSSQAKKNSQRKQKEENLKEVKEEK